MIVVKKSEMFNCYDTTGKRDLAAIGIGTYDDEYYDRGNFQVEINCIKAGMESVGFTCDEFLNDEVTKHDAEQYIEYMISDGKQKSKDMFALSISSIVAIRSFIRTFVKNNIIILQIWQH